MTFTTEGGTFAASEPPAGGPGPWPDGARPRRRIRATAVGWLLLVLGVAGAIVIGMTPAPYVIEQPGPAYNTLGVTNGGKDSRSALIQIPDATTYPTRGALDLLTVSIVGSPQRPLNWIDIAGAWFDRTKSVVPLEAVFAPGVSDEESEAQSAAQMTSSQREAIAAALRELGYTVPGTVTVDGVLADGAAKGVLETGDRILTVDGEAVPDATALREAIGAAGAGTPIALGIQRDGVDSTVDVTARLSEPDADGRRVPLVGIVPGVRYDYPVTVRIRLDDVGGPSAGMMFALGIIDKLTPGAMTGGQKIAGTGTIDSQGEVGPIGGIRQKMYGAKDAGARWFLAPAANCGEVVGHVPDGLTVYSVKTLDQARDAVEAIGSGAGRAQLPTCTEK